MAVKKFAVGQPHRPTAENATIGVTAKYFQADRERSVWRFVNTHATAGFYIKWQAPDRATSDVYEDASATDWDEFVGPGKSATFQVRTDAISIFPAATGLVYNTNLAVRCW